MKPVRKAVLPVAGLGTRVLPIAKSVPKNMLNVFDRPILSYVLAEGRAAGIEHFVMITGRGQETIEHYFDRQPEIEYQLRAKGKTDPISRWAVALAERRGYWRAVVAIAAKNARMAWAVLRRGEAFALPS